MIEKRPASLLADASYCRLPKPPFLLDWTSIPELLRVSMLDLGGIQPLTDAMFKAASGTLHDIPSEGETALFRERGTTFQLVSVVLSCVAAGAADGGLRLRPFALTLIPASKRGAVDERPIDAIGSLNVADWLKNEPIYSGYDPFSGEWSMFGFMPGYLDGAREGFVDEIGMVVDQYFLATTMPDDDAIVALDLKMPSEQMKVRYERHRKKLLFTPFKKVEARRVWGAETPIELFLLEGLARANLFPECQVLIMNDGAVFPSLYHLWQDIEFRHADALVTEADLYFPDAKVAVFCDGGHHSRGKQKAKDQAMTETLKGFGIKSVRIPSAEIQLDLPAAIARVRGALT